MKLNSSPVPTYNSPLLYPRIRGGLDDIKKGYVGGESAGPSQLYVTNYRDNPPAYYDPQHLTALAVAPSAPMDYAASSSAAIPPPHTSAGALAPSMPNAPNMGEPSISAASSEQKATRDGFGNLVEEIISTDDSSKSRLQKIAVLLNGSSIEDTDHIVKCVFHAMNASTLKVKGGIICLSICGHDNYGYKAHPTRKLMRAKDQSGQTLLMYAVRAQCGPDSIKYLVMGGSDLSAVDSKGRNALHLVAAAANEDTLITLIGLCQYHQLCSLLGARDQEGRTPLMTMADSGHVKAIKKIPPRILKKTAPIVDKEGFMFLHYILKLNKDTKENKTCDKVIDILAWLVANQDISVKLPTGNYDLRNYESHRGADAQEEDFGLRQDIIKQLDQLYPAPKNQPKIKKHANDNANIVSIRVKSHNKTRTSLPISTAPQP